MNGDDGDSMGVPAGATSYRAICAGVGTESRIVTLSPSIPIIPFLTLFWLTYSVILRFMTLVDRSRNNVAASE